jgi:hypothetical protein
VGFVGEGRYLEDGTTRYVYLLWGIIEELGFIEGKLRWNRFWILLRDDDDPDFLMDLLFLLEPLTLVYKSEWLIFLSMTDLPRVFPSKFISR